MSVKKAAGAGKGNMVNLVILLECFGICLTIIALILLLNGEGAKEQKLLILFLVEPQEIAVILLADLVSGKDDDILGIVPLNKGNILVNRICRTLVPVRTGRLLIWRKHMHSAVQTVQIPRLPVSNILI